MKTALYGGAFAVAGIAATVVAAHAVTSPSTKARLKQQRDAMIAALKAAIARGADGIGPLPGKFIDDDGDDPKADDPLLRALWTRLDHGPSSPQSVARLFQETARQRQREQAYTASARRLADAGGAAPTSPTTLRWSRLGPQSALSEWNFGYFDGVDSGRVATIRVDPTNPATVYIGAIGGGIWKTPDITLTTPQWTPLTDTLGTMFIGSFDLDPTDPSVIHVGLGDYWEGNPGGVMVTTHDGGTTWGPPVALTAELGGAPIHADSVRTVRVDPNNHDTVLAASDIGLFRSTDGGATYQRIDLPNTAPYGTDLEGMYSVVYTGLSATGQSTFLASGVYACPGDFPPSFSQPVASFFVTDCPAGTPAGNGNLGDIWTSSDGGATWSSARVAGLLPAVPDTVGDPPTFAITELGRINLAAVPGPTLATQAVVYAIASNQDGTHTTAVLRSANGGGLWSQVGFGQFTVPQNPNFDCQSLDVGHTQSTYDLAISVDPGNANNILIGGNLCGARSVDGGVTWQLASHWLGEGFGVEGQLPYVHADWHASQVTRVNGQPIALAGCDGGIFASFDVFAAQRGTDGHWFDANVGLDTHLPYSVGSGDPVLGTAGQVMAGLQDNGTRVRVSQTEAFLSPFPRAWNQITGGDGFGAAVASTPTGDNLTLWGDVNGTRGFCRAGAGIECSRATHVVDNVELPSYENVVPPLPEGDVDNTFTLRFAATYDPAGSVVTNSTFNLWKMASLPGNGSTVTRLTTSPAPPDPGGFTGCGTSDLRQIRDGGPVVSPFTYQVNGAAARVYGLPLTGGCYTVVVDTGRSDGVVTAVPARTSVQFGGQQVFFTESITFPRDPSHLSGDATTDITQTYVVGNAGDFDGNSQPILDATGHVFLTKDGGATWTPIHGNGTGFDLPNVRVYVVRFDPSDPTDQTLWAGTDLGLYRTTDLGQTWVRYGTNLPMVRVQDVFVAQNGSLVRVAMYGRGVWEIYPRSDGFGGRTGQGDFDGNGIIDFRDVLNLANRLTVSAPGAELPVYDAEMNLTEDGTATTLDDSDLQALLAKFGGAP
ncbi:MAG TPA: hypothetical protein VHW23_47935 [Kofleriaceae bacterium]|nr:hypothetical protein [Kofleriaceae bacterium]